LTVEQGTVTHVEGDPEHPLNRGTLCSMGLAARQLLYHPDRLQHPLKRVGERGEGQWQQISWDQAYDEISSRLQRFRAESGAESIALIQGTGRDYAEFLYRFANVYGTPNVTTPGYLCYFPRVVTHLATCGALPVADYAEKPACVIIWGCNPHVTSPEEYQGFLMVDALDTTKLIVIDPRYTTLADRAEIWLQIRPGTDTALGLGMLHVLLEEGWYDREFVEEYTTGLDQLRERVREYTPERVEEISWVPRHKLRAAVELYATTKPAAINPGQVLDGNVNCVSNALILSHLMALTGNLDQRGGNALYAPPPVQSLSKFALHDKLSEAQRKKRIGGAAFPVADWGMMTPAPLLCRAILEGDPYRIRGMLIHGSNVLVSWPDSERVYEALRAVEYLLVADLFMTPTAALADIVLPVASWMETDDIANYWLRNGIVSVRQKAVQIGECKSDQEIFNELGRRLGYEEEFFSDMASAMNTILEPAGLSWQEFCEVGVLRGPVRYEKYRQRGFSTPSRKYEFVPTRLKDTGADPFPSYIEPPESPVSRPDLARDYPLILVTGIRQPVFFHSEGRQIPVLREKWPESRYWRSIRKPPRASECVMASGCRSHLPGARLVYAPNSRWASLLEWSRRRMPGGSLNGANPTLAGVSPTSIY
jgi:anaerobic selenocysteine-containing dehydrogenase